MKTWLKALEAAFIFLTRIPMATIDKLEPEDEGRSLLCFPFVGVAIGLILWLIAVTLSNMLQPIVLAALLLAFWAAITGGLHLDGLADSADGWLGGLGDVDRTLEIMRDSRCGSGALTTVVCLLILKFAALTVIVQQQLWLALIIAPIIGRCTGPLLFLPGPFLYAPYVQPKGIAKNFIDHCPGSARHVAVMMVLFCGLLVGDIYQAFIIIASSTLIFYLMRNLMLKRLGGATGDTAGATTEVVETVVLMSYGVALGSIV